MPRSGEYSFQTPKIYIIAYPNVINLNFLKNCFLFTLSNLEYFKT